jgi:exodeoxyribonuclease V alpha subunit
MNALLAKLRESGHLRRVDVTLGEWLARAFPAAPPEAALAAALAARAVADGHSALELARAQAWLEGLDATGRTPALPELVHWRDALRASAAVLTDGTGDGLRPLVLDAQGRVYLHRYFEYELQLARALVIRAQSTAIPASDPSPPSRSADTDPAQQRAIDTALARRFTLVTGGPGTGKTYVAVRILAALAQQAHARGAPLRIALAAPTGKAAARLKEAVHAGSATLALPDDIAALIPGEAHTVHRLLGLSPWSATPRHQHETPLPFDVVVVDEISMLDLPLMAKLIDAVAPAARLVLLGDPAQLAAIEAGNVLGALVDAARAAPIADCHVALTTSHRFGAGSSLAGFARAIAAGDGESALAIGAAGGDVELAAPAPSNALLDAAAEAYAGVLDAGDPAAALRAARAFRVLTALRHGPAGCLALDQTIAQRLQRRAGVRADERWWQGRLLMVTANRPELGLFNGDSGVVWPDANGAMQVWFEAGDGPRAFAPAALPPHEGAFALTVHKAQGSEFDRIALVTGPDSAVLTRELLYTGVTRARASMVVHSTGETLRAGIERCTLRMTGLADRVREAAAGT